MNGTGIMATVTAGRCRRDFLESLYKRGMTSVRINSAHVDESTLMQMCADIRAVSPGIRILMDTKGPEIRTTAVVSDIEFQEGDDVILRYGTEETTSRTIRINVEGLEACVAADMSVLIDDGEIALKVAGTGCDGIHCVVTRGGMLGSRKTLSIPDAKVPQLPAVSEQDRRNIRAGIVAGVDMIAHSFVRSRYDVEAVRKEISGTDIELYAKIECREGVANMADILDAADGLLVARGDLGSQMPLWDIPVLQYRALKACRKAGKPSIVATQILQSMITHSVPTRAEVSDIALAVMEGADTLLLCGETAVGEYAAECVDIMRRTIDSVTRNELRCKIY